MAGTTVSPQPKSIAELVSPIAEITGVVRRPMTSWAECHCVVDRIRATFRERLDVMYLEVREPVQITERCWITAKFADPIRLREDPRNHSLASNKVRFAVRQSGWSLVTRRRWITFLGGSPCAGKLKATSNANLAESISNRVQHDSESRGLNGVADRVAGTCPLTTEVFNDALSDSRLSTHGRKPERIRDSLKERQMLL